MGFDKAALLVEGVPNAVRLAALLVEVAAPVVEVGPGRSGLPAVREEPPGSGPLAAVGAGVAWLGRAGYRGAALAVACDLPFLDAGALRALASWPGEGSAVPFAGGYPQPLCARWSARDLAAATQLVEAGERSMRALLARPGVVLVDEGRWPAGLSARVLADVDTPEDLRRLGLGAPPATVRDGSRGAECRGSGTEESVFGRR
jgi:molybdopterin-guanine dinucleotide biosynthesis protein A